MVSSMPVLLVFISIFVGLSCVTAVFGYFAFFMYTKYRADQTSQYSHAPDLKREQVPYQDAKGRAGGDTLIANDLRDDSQ
jgi:hypothetical protein